MENYRAIPEGYMTVGDLAKKLNTTVRTLQYYDKEGLLSPSAESDGGRRLYTDKDVVKLHQILSLKYLGFSLNDIKTRLVALETPSQVEKLLEGQASQIADRINELQGVLTSIQALQAEVAGMQQVDFAKYAEIITLLQLGNENYWVVKHFESKTMEHIKNRFDEQSARALYDQWVELCSRAVRLLNKGVTPDSEQAQNLAKDWWDMVLEFTGGDMSLMAELEKISQNKSDWSPEQKQNWEIAESFISNALEIYMQTLHSNAETEEVK